MLRIIKIAVIFCVMLFPSLIFASPVYYTVESTVSARYDTVGIIARAGINIGDKVKHVFFIDKDRFGTVTDSATGTVSEYNSPYAELYSGLLKGVRSSTDGDSGLPMFGIPNVQNNMVQSWYGLPGVGSLSILASNVYSNLELSSMQYTLDDLVVGFKFSTMGEIAWSSLRRTDYSKLVFTDVTITAISDRAPGSTPTPIPGAVLLLGGGIGVVGFLRRKFARS